MGGRIPSGVIYIEGTKGGDWRGEVRAWWSVWVVSQGMGMEETPIGNAKTPIRAAISA
jgi:hypothetical protein